MKHRNIVFHRLLTFLPRQRFQAMVDRHKGDHRTRTLSCWDHLIALLIGQLSGRQSLRDLEDGFNSKQAHHYHLGTRAIRRSFLSDANHKRPVAIFQETFFDLLKKVRSQLPGKVSADMVRLIDSTTIDLNLNQFEWAKFRSSKSGVKLHTVYDPNAEVPVYFEMTHAKVNDRKALACLPILSGVTYVVDRAYNDYSGYYSLDKVGSTFVGRMKTNARDEVIESRVTESDQVLSDEVIRLNSDKAKTDCPIPLRRIVFERSEDNKVLVFISNDLDRSAEEIAALYRQRRQIELFFKWIKQNLNIKQFFGRSENAVMIQVLVAMIAYLLLKLIQQGIRCNFSLQKIARILSLNLTARRTIEDLLHPNPGREMRNNEIPPQLELEISYA